MTSTAQVLVLSPDQSLLQVATSSARALGHEALHALATPEAQRILDRVRVDLICIDSLVPQDELQALWRWLVSVRDNATPSVLLMAPPSAATMRSLLPSFFRQQRDGLVTKPIDAPTFTKELARVLDDAVIAPRPDVLRVGSLQLDRIRRRLRLRDRNAVALTPTETKLMSALMGRPGEYFTADTLLDRVWGFPEGTGGAEIVRAHVSNVRRKLRDSDADPMLIRNTPNQGYTFEAVAKD